MDWELEIQLHYPHDRFMLGREFLQATEEYNYRTIKLYLFIVTFTLDFWTRVNKNFRLLKKQIQRIQQLIDKLPNGKIRKELFKKLLKLKTKI